jgi:hypothetical protein
VRESEKSVMSKSMDRLDARLLVRLSMCACQGLGLPMSVCLLQESSIVSPNKYSQQKNMRHPWVRFLFYSLTALNIPFTNCWLEKKMTQCGAQKRHLEQAGRPGPTVLYLNSLCCPLMMYSCITGRERRRFEIQVMKQKGASGLIRNNIG